MAADNSKSYLGHLNNFIDQYNSTYHHFVNKKSIDIDYSNLTEKL